MTKRRRDRQIQQNQQVTLTRVTHQQQVRIAPLPDPEELARFDQILHGLANRIVTMAEQNAADRRSNNQAMRWATILGQVFAFVMVMSALGGGFYLINSGRDAAGMAAIITAIGVPLGTYVFSRSHRQTPPP